MSASQLRPDHEVTRHRHIEIDGIDLFYREAGPADALVVVLLHGFPTSSRMYRNLIPALADRYRVIAPDYPGFGQSAMPPREDYPYGFAAYATIVEQLLDALRIERYALYVMDYGAPVGLRLALAHPERVSALISQNGNAYEEGLSPFWDGIKAYWARPDAATRDAICRHLTLDGIKAQYLDGVRDPTRVDPDSWVHDHALMQRPGNIDIQLDLLLDYRGNVELYPEFQAFFREWQPPALIAWGANDAIFPPEGARAYLRDLPDAELHLLDTGHFALEDQGDALVGLIRDFLDRRMAANRPSDGA